VITSAAWSFALDKAVALGYLKRGIESPRLTAGSTEVEVRGLPLID
jgi:glycine cleavage system aminomethyltransferase T